MPSPWMSRRNPFKEALRAGQRAVAMWVTTPWSGVVEILATAGADAAFVDLEHVSYGISEVERLVIASEAAGISPIVRPARGDGADVSRLLDAGAHGIVFPQIETAADAVRAVASMRYRPQGSRGWGGAHTRFAGWTGAYATDVFARGGSDADVYCDAYVRAANDFPLVMLLVETACGVNNVDEIARSEGVDALIFGWGDFAVECGFDVDACRRAAAAVYEAASRSGVGVAVSRAEDFYPGCFAIAGVDSLHAGAAVTAAVRDAGRRIGMT